MLVINVSDPSGDERLWLVTGTLPTGVSAFCCLLSAPPVTDGEVLAEKIQVTLLYV